MTSPSHRSGYYAAGPKKSSPKLLVILVLVLAAGVLAVAFLRGSDPDPADDPGDALASAPSEPEPERPLIKLGESDDELAELRAENTRLHADLERLEDILSGSGGDERLRELEAENAALKDEVEDLRGQVARHRAGLERAVAELNSGQRPAKKTRPAADKSSDSSKWVFPRDPYAVVNVGQVDVEGSVHNANGETVHGYLMLTVLENSQELTQERFGPITILGQSVKDYRYTISYPGIHDGPSYEVKATWVSE